MPPKIAERAGVNPNPVGKYLKTLVSLGIIERIAPLGERSTSRNARYQIRDPFFAYWYRFVSRYLGSIEEGAGRRACPGSCAHGEREARPGQLEHTW